MTRSSDSKTTDPRAADRQALLALHALERRAHLESDARVLAGVFAEHVWEAGRGQLTRLSRSELEDRFAAYFESVSYSVWDDLQPPHVAVAEDGKTGWMAIHIEARLNALGDANEGGERSFESAWIATYAKSGAEWQMVGISSSVVDRKG